eukprot:CAMPEP_0117758256 /NCGR_PEP_ID=MMETSP0947-20121206/15265_1 /TAXON_ID=44440 /ORGANISM="Chattonella subsalsa, Strain CCMP2191" /LENGTH=277 /DNA_ID=CAMNT_0005578399 /DNA_START=36 /DNA_END=869 /DNA_ORIENTATION=+
MSLKLKASIFAAFLGTSTAFLNNGILSARRSSGTISKVSSSSEEILVRGQDWSHFKEEEFLGIIGSDVELPEFDPLNLAEGKTKEQLKWYREAELTHGRVAMLAVLGIMVPDTKTFLSPVTDNFIAKILFGTPDLVFDERNPLKAVSKVPPMMWIEISALILACELIRIQKTIKGQNEPGDLEFDNFGLMDPLPQALIDGADWEGDTPTWKGDRFGENATPSAVFGVLPEGKAKLLMMEIKHCRLGMLAATGLLLQNIITGQSFCEQMQGYGFNAFR